MDITNQIENVFLPKVNELVETRYTDGFPKNCKDVITVSYGKKYARLVATQKGNKWGSAFGFIDLSNGDILKAAGWEAPAKGVRGNIFRDNPLEGVTPYGIEYLR